MQKNIKNALLALQYLESKHLELAEGLELKIISWNDDTPKELAKKIISNHKQYAKNMSDIKSILTAKPKRKKNE